MATNNILDLPRDQFMASLNELAAQGVNTDELMRQYRRANSPFSGLFDWAINSERDIANEGRTTAGAGLFSKEAGTTGMDALASTRIEPANFIAGLLSGGAQAVDAAGATLKGLVPAADMPMEALGTAGMAMTGGAAAPKPRGALGANALRQVDEYGGSHRAPRRSGDYGASLDDPREMFGGDDIYTSNAARYFGHGDPAMDRESIRAINTARSNPDAEVTVYRAVPKDLEGAQINAGDWVTPSRRYANLHGEGPLGGDYQIIEQKVRAGDLFTDGDIHEWGYDPLTTSANRDATTGAIALPAARNEAERMARQILEMRAAGRAGDVTDAMMAQADPQYMFNNTPLPMDEASRMARAGEMGFDTRVYHGSRDDITSMDQLKGSAEGGAGTLFSSDEARVANTYATKRLGSEGENVLPLLANVSNYGESGYKTPFPFNGSDVAIEQWLTGLDRFNRTLDNSKTSYFENAIRSARNAGQSGTVIRQVEDDAVSSIQTMPSDVHVTLDPTTIRSRFARFDPEFSHLANLNAANASPLAGILAMPNEEERNRQLGMLFGGYR